jgi:hypothetical protein
VLFWNNIKAHNPEVEGSNPAKRIKNGVFDNAMAIQKWHNTPRM